MNMLLGVNFTPPEQYTFHRDSSLLYWIQLADTSPDSVTQGLGTRSVNDAEIELPRPEGGYTDPSDIPADDP